MTDKAQKSPVPMKSAEDLREIAGEALELRTP